jgi:hypothetical protein
MGSGSNPSIKTDLFSAQHPSGTSSQAASAPKSKDKPAAAPSPSYALPTNLPSALSHLDNDQLDRLLAAVLAEREARGGKKPRVPDEPPCKKPSKEAAPSLPQGKLNAIRAAFKAGVKPPQIARQFGISVFDVKEEIEKTADEIMRGATEIAEKLRELADAIREHSKIANEHVSGFCNKATSVLEGVRDLQLKLEVK